MFNRKLNLYLNIPTGMKEWALIFLTCIKHENLLININLIYNFMTKYCLLLLLLLLLYTPIGYGI